MASGKKHKHWSDRVHESVVSRNKNGQLNLVIKGGAEEVKFPFFGSVKQDKVIYHSGKILDSEILLEVNDQSVAGLTLFDLNNLIKQARDPVRFKTVKEGQTLTKDLKLYLSERFQQGTVDHELQAAIRDNLYLRTLPCTTRSPKNGEQDGVDYTFLTVEQFQELEKSGSLLESGLYEGNYYGTPKPPPVPLSPPTVHRSNSSNDIMPGARPSSEGKRKRNRSTVEMQPLSASSSPSKSPPVNNNKETRSPTSTSNQISEPEKIESPKAQNSPQQPQNGFGLDLGPLPDGWEEAVTETGDKYYIDHIGQKTSWLDPRLTTKPRKALEECADDELPYGWEKVADQQFGTYYVDHVEKKTQFDNPVLQAKAALKNKQNNTVNDVPVEQGNFIHSPELLNHEHNDQAFLFTNDPSQLQGVTYKVPIEKSPQGFGFTIVGGDEPEEFLQIKSVVTGGPADKTGNICQGDVIVQVSDVCVLGWTHPQVVQLFQSFPIGHIVSLHVCRGYPLPFDPEDPNTSIVTTHAIRPDDRPLEEFERQLRELNKQLEVVPNFGAPGGGGYFTSASSKSMPDIADYKNYNPGYYPENMYEGMGQGMIQQQSQPNQMRTGSMNSLQGSTSQVLQVILKKGDHGFGFTITDSPQGQRIKQILDDERCHNIREGDILLEINGNAVQNMPHNNVVEILKECPSNAEAIFVIQRISPLKNYPPANDMVSPTQQQQQGNPRGYQHGGYQGAPYRGRMKRNHMDMPPTENGSVVSAPPTSLNTYNHPMGPLISEFKSKHSGIPTSMGYMENGGYDPLPNNHHMGMMYPGSMDGFIDLTVVLHRQESGFGFRILGGDYTDEKVTIGAIVAGGAADFEGSLRSGDELLSVDGQSVVGIGHSQVVSLMGNAARNGIVQLCIRRRVGATQIAQRPKFAQPRAPSRGVISTPLSYYDVVIQRRKHEGFGFVIISSVKVSEQIPGSYVPHKIGRIIDGSPAARCKQLHVGDRILAVNGVDIHDLHHGQIVNLIKESGMSIMLRVVCNPNQDEYTRGSCFTVELHKSSKGFGFGIRGGREYNMPLYVLRMAEDGPAAETGKIQVGDILLEVNGHDATDMPHSSAITVIKQGGQVLRLVLKKGDGCVPDLGNDFHDDPHLPASQSTCSW